VESPHRLAGGVPRSTVDPDPVALSATGRRQQAAGYGYQLPANRYTIAAMRHQKLLLAAIFVVSTAWACKSTQPQPAAEPAAAAAAAPERGPDVIFVPTPQEVVDAMLKLAKVTKNDVIYDLGSGDGRIPITAAKTYGARATGIDIDPQRIKEATENLKVAGVGDRVRFLNQDLFTTDISEATVVTLYLLPSLNVKLLPKLNKELKPGTRIVSHAFDMSADCVERKPLETMTINGRSIYFWTIPIK
jgi:predicted O-methyltransferase YrrM